MGWDVQAALVERVLAEEMDGWEVERGAAGGASARVEDGGFGCERCQFVPFCGGRVSV